MGAHTIATVGYGKTPSEAYNRAVDDAQWEDGHDPYNGTISTTGGFKMDRIRQKRLTEKAIRQWITEAEDRTEKWGPCLCIEFPRNHSESKRARAMGRGQKAYLFVGWAAS